MRASQRMEIQRVTLVRHGRLHAPPLDTTSLALHRFLLGGFEQLLSRVQEAPG
jgi:hypothetical protein